MADRPTSIEGVLTLALVGAGLYLLARVSRLGAAVADDVSAFIADKYIKLALPEPVNVSGHALLPDGTLVPMASLQVRKVPDQEFFYFDLKGQRYQLGPRTAQGNWPTRRVAS